MGCLRGKPVVHFQSTKAKYKDHSQGDVFEISSCARTRQETCMFCSQETRCLMWWQPSECAEDLARANWTAAFISLMDLRILWLGWSQNCWINWHLTVAKCTVPSGLSHRLCCNNRAVRICVAGCCNCTKGDPSLVAVTPRSHISYYSLSLATCHPVQCSPNMRVADCSTVWVGKCLQLINRGALHLTLFEIYRINCSSSQSNKLVLSNPWHAWPCLCLCSYVARNEGWHRHKSVRVIRTLHESARIIANPHLSGKEQCWNGDRVWAPSWSVQTAPAKVVSKRKWPRGSVPSRAKAIKHHVLKLFPSLSMLEYTDVGSVWYMQDATI